jgi:three-Cys-motif partner protein
VGLDWDRPDGDEGNSVSKGSSGDFFVRKKAPAVLKHELLRQYVEPFTGMVGSTSDRGRVVFLDGYAGQGRYDDGSAGSPELAMKAAEALLPGRLLECVFVERDRQPFTSLETVTAEYAARGVHCRALRGSVEDHLDDVIAQAAGAPLFMFLDPCGLSLPLDILVRVLVGPRSATPPPTETLLNFSNEAVRRIGAATSGRRRRTRRHSNAWTWPAAGTGGVRLSSGRTLLRRESRPSYRGSRTDSASGPAIMWYWFRCAGKYACCHFTISSSLPVVIMACGCSPMHSRKLSENGGRRSTRTSRRTRRKPVCFSAWTACSRRTRSVFKKKGSRR